MSEMALTPPNPRLQRRRMRAPLSRKPSGENRKITDADPSR
jgi:hypothetical protein